MLVSVINRILQSIDVYEESRRRRNRRRARMNSRELKVERIEREVTRNVACDFIDDEAIETDDDCSFDGFVEDGFDETMFDDRPRDSNGKVYVRLIG